MMTTISEPKIEIVQGFEEFNIQVDEEFARRRAFYAPDASNEGFAMGRNFLSYEALPPFLKTIYDIDPKNKVLQALEEYCIDDGLSKSFSVAVKIDGSEQEFYTTGAHILNRNGLVSKALEGNEELEEARKANLTVVKLDLKGFRNIDIIPTEGSFKRSTDDEVKKVLGDPLNTTRGSESLADVVATEAAIVAQAKVDAINYVLQTNGIPGEVYWGRIGGDEFGVVFKGIHDDRLINNIFQLIISPKDGIQSIDTYYFREEDSTIYSGKVEVKEDYTIIKMGEGDQVVAAKQFEKLKENANFFTEEEIRRELSHVNDGITLPADLQQIYDSHKRDFSKENEQLLSNIINDNPELAQLYLELNKLGGGFEKGFTDFCVDYAYDRLSHTSVSNLRIFMNKVVAGTLETDLNKKYLTTTFFAFDLQGPKGINDLVSYGATDLAVLSTILRLTAVKNEARKTARFITRGIEVLIGRSGTKVLVCVATPASISIDRSKRDAVIHKLIDIKNAELIEDEFVCKVPLAQSRMDRRVTSLDLGRVLFRRLIDTANDSFKQSKILSLLTLTGNSDDKMKLETINKLLAENYESPKPGMKLSEFLQDRIFIPEYFRRVRVIERMTDLIRACSTLIDSYSALNLRRDASSTQARLVSLRNRLLDVRNRQKAS